MRLPCPANDLECFENSEFSMAATRGDQMSRSCAPPEEDATLHSRPFIHCWKQRALRCP